MEIIKYTKINGAGNDFILVDRKLNPGLEISSDAVVALCNREAGIGADGVILVGDSKEYDFEMSYYNADGSGGTLCGNGARCAIKYAEVSGRVSNKTNFLCNGIKYSGQILPEEKIKFYLNPPGEIKNEVKVEILGQSINTGYVNVGSRHLVVFIKNILSDKQNIRSFYNDLDKFPVYEVGKEIRYSSQFAPEGVNVNFVNIIDGKIYIRSYERGVERETLACGTGSVSAAVISVLKGELTQPVKLITRSNAELVVDFDLNDDNITNLSLIGPVEINFNGEYSI